MRHKQFASALRRNLTFSLTVALAALGSAGCTRGDDVGLARQALDTPPLASTVTLTTDQSAYAAGTTSVNVSFSGVPSSGSYELGLQQQWQSQGRWQFLTTTSGTATFQNLSPGTYTAVLSSDSTTVLA